MAKRWALILGASSGFGEAASRRLAAAGWPIFGVHLDRRAGMQHVEELIAHIEGVGVRAKFFNMNAADAEKREAALQEMRQVMEPGDDVGILMHSLAFGTLRPFVGDDPMTEAQMDMTLRVMAHSLVDWTQALLSRDMMGKNGRIYAMTSSGSSRVIPTYGAVSAAKSALESHIRQLAYELTSRGITANAIRAGVTDTPALRKIPGNDILLDGAARKNPTGRLTTPADVADCIVALADPGTYWLTGNVLNVDGGEEIMAG